MRFFKVNGNGKGNDEDEDEDTQGIESDPSLNYMQ
jgi:hypothetical protein